MGIGGGGTFTDSNTGNLVHTQHGLELKEPRFSRWCANHGIICKVVPIQVHSIYGSVISDGYPAVSVEVGETVTLAS